MSLQRKQLSRRAFVGASALVGAPLLLPRIAAVQGTPEPAAGGEWTFTDDRGVTITLPKRPERIVAQINSAAALWDFGIQVIATFGPAIKEDGTREPTAGSIDFEVVEQLNNDYTDPDLEALLALQPDLIVSTTFDPSDPTSIWRVSPEIVPTMEEIAPIAAISIVGGTILQPIERFAELAASLGADLESAEITGAKAAFETASADVTAAVEENPGLQALFIAGLESELYICGSAYYIDLAYFKELGVEIVEPEDPSGTDVLSWEQATKFPADVIFNDYRSSSPFLRTEQLMEIPTFAVHPAAVAGQISNWYYEYVLSYSGFVFNLEELAKTIRASKADLV